MAELVAGDWVTSKQKIRHEKRLVYPAYPFAMAAAGIAIAAMRVTEPDHPSITREDRSLIPDIIYQIPKIGSRGDMGQHDPSRRLSELYSKLMIDELLHLRLILAGSASLVGPRGTTPEHRARLFDSLSGKDVDEWRHILSLQRHGVIDSYSLSIHGRPGSGISYDSERGLGDKAVQNEAEVRFEANKQDFYNASRQYDNHLLQQFGTMVLSRATGGRIG